MANFDYLVTSIVLFSIGLSILFANISKIRQTTSQSSGFSIIAVGLQSETLNTELAIYKIIPSWFYFPLISFFLTQLIGAIKKKYFHVSIRSNSDNSFYRKLISISLIIGSLFVSYAIGSINVANAAAPLISLSSLINLLGFSELLIGLVVVFIISLFYGGGALLFGSKIIKENTSQMTEFDLSEGVVILFIIVSLMLIASVFQGLPVALAQINLGSILGMTVYKYGYKKSL
jgi:phosphate/sulfate permease